MPIISLKNDPRDISQDEMWTIFKIIYEYTPYGWENMFNEIVGEVDSISKILKEDCKTYFPLKRNLLRTYHSLAPEQIKVVIIAQDPYPSLTKDKTEPLSNGIAFFISKGETVSPSLRNIYKELKDEYPDFNIPNHGDLTNWIQQGIFLINASLTRDPSLPDQSDMQHFERKLWYPVITKTLQHIKTVNPNVVFITWGAKAKSSIKLCKFKKVTQLESAHPSSRAMGNVRDPFIGNGHFKKCNELLEKTGQIPIEWNCLA